MRRSQSMTHDPGAGGDGGGTAGDGGSVRVGAGLAGGVAVDGGPPGPPPEPVAGGEARDAKRAGLRAAPPPLLSRALSGPAAPGGLDGSGVATSAMEGGSAGAADGSSVRVLSDGGAPGDGTGLGGAGPGGRGGGGPGLRGWLHKMQDREVNVLGWGGGSGARWSERYFVLDGGALLYYR